MNSVPPPRESHCLSQSLACRPASLIAVFEVAAVNRDSVGEALAIALAAIPEGPMPETFELRVYPTGHPALDPSGYPALATPAAGLVSQPK